MQVVIRAIGPKSAEMVTDEGAIYVTSNNGYNWKAAVEETVSATLNRYIIRIEFAVYDSYEALFCSDLSHIFCKSRSIH